MVKKIIKNIIFGHKASSERLIKHLKKNGASIGKNVKFYAPNKTIIDETSPFLLTIGNNVMITEGVTILTHDASWIILSRLNKNKGRILGGQAPVNIGNNVFIGMNATITMGVTINDNVIIGAGSVVTKDCEPNSVYAGVPAKRIMSTTDLINKKINEQFEQAKQIALNYYKVYAVRPPKEVFREYFMLFSNYDEAFNIPEFNRLMTKTVGDDFCKQYMKENSPMFSSYEEFLNSCFSN